MSQSNYAMVATTPKTDEKTSKLVFYLTEIALGSLHEGHTVQESNP
jgi:hypothetical protein